MTGAELKAWRTQHGYSQSVLALMLGVHTGSLSRWERGTRAIPPMIDLALKTLGGEQPSAAAILQEKLFRQAIRDVAARQLMKEVAGTLGLMEERDDA
jgi:transcriptional regulator with XRE-family HTH domain